jgi:hypothetical protein
VEQLIRQSFTTEGIAVADEGKAAAILDVGMDLQCEPRRSACGYRTEFALWQWAQLTRDPSVQVAAVTWHNSYSNGISKIELGILPDMLMLDVRTLLGLFVAQYREANPR